MDEIAQAYGSLTEGLHLTGYAFERACGNLEWLLEGDRWKQCGNFADVNGFLTALHLDKFRTAAETRARLAKRIKELQPKVSNRTIGSTLGVSEATIRRDTASNDAINLSNPAGISNGAATNVAQSGEAAAKAAQRAANKSAAGQAKKVHRADREAKLAERTRAASASLGSTVYGVIYADPPWRFEPYSRDTGMDRAADNHYPTMTLAEVADLSIPAADDAVLFLWATVPMLPEALMVMSAWGFDYKSHFAWVKDKAGTGYWNRNRHELLLVGTRGNIPAPAPGTQYDSVIEVGAERHSAKPFHFHEIIEDMFPLLPRIELFARGGPMVGWDRWGNEAEQAAQ